MVEPKYGEQFRKVGEYDAIINTPSKNPAYFHKFHAPVIDEAKIHSHNGKVTVLGIASGPGNEFEFMKDDPNLQVIGFDLDPKFISQAHAKFKSSPARLDFFVGDTRKPPFKESIADVAIAVNALIYNPGELLEAAYRGLKPGGKLVVNARIFGNEFNKPFYDTQTERGSTLEDEELEANGKSFKLKVVNYATNKVLPQLGKQVYFTSEEDLEEFIKAKGFHLDKHDKFHFSSPDNPDNEVEVYTLQKPR